MYNKKYRIIIDNNGEILVREAPIQDGKFSMSVKIIYTNFNFGLMHPWTEIHGYDFDSSDELETILLLYWPINSLSYTKIYNTIIEKIEANEK